MCHFMIVLIPCFNLLNLSWTIKCLFLRDMEPLKNGFCSVTFEKISELNSYFIHKHIIIKYRSGLI